MDAQYTGKKIAELRKAKSWTQKDVADRLNVSVAAVSKWERGLNFPDMSLLEPIADALNVSVASLLGLEHESADEIISNMAQMSNIEKETHAKSIKRKLILSVTAAAVFVIASFGIYFLWENEKAVEMLFSYDNAWFFNMLALVLGITSWCFGIGAIFSEKNSGKFSFVSLMCCSIALYIPVLIADIAMRFDGYGTVEDTIFAYNFASAVLLTGAVVFNLFAQRRKNK